MMTDDIERDDEDIVVHTAITSPSPTRRTPVPVLQTTTPPVITPTAPIPLHTVSSGSTSGTIFKSTPVHPPSHTSSPVTPTPLTTPVAQRTGDRSLSVNHTTPSSHFNINCPDPSPRILSLLKPVESDQTHTGEELPQAIAPLSLTYTNGISEVVNQELPPSSSPAAVVQESKKRKGAGVSADTVGTAAKPPKHSRKRDLENLVPTDAPTGKRSRTTVKFGLQFAAGTLKPPHERRQGWGYV